MTIYRCANCGSVLDEDELDTDEYWETMDSDGNQERHIDVFCPVCGSDELEKYWRAFYNRDSDRYCIPHFDEEFFDEDVLEDGEG